MKEDLLPWCDVSESERSVKLRMWYDGDVSVQVTAQDDG